MAKPPRSRAAPHRARCGRERAGHQGTDAAGAGGQGVYRLILDAARHARACPDVAGGRCGGLAEGEADRGLIHRAMTSSTRRPVRTVSPTAVTYAPTFAVTANLREIDQSHPVPKEDSMVLSPGARAPDFTLNKTPGEKLTLASLRGRPVILVFYPADWRPVCGDELALFN